MFMFMVRGAWCVCIARVNARGGRQSQALRHGLQGLNHSYIVLYQIAAVRGNI